MWAKLGKVLLKAGKVVIKSLVSLGRSIGPAAKKTVDYFKTHPKELAFILGMAADSTMDNITSALVKKFNKKDDEARVAAENFADLVNITTDKDIENALAELNKYEKPLHQSPRFWAPEDRVNSVFTEMSGLEKNALFNHVRVRNMVFDYQEASDADNRLWPMDAATIEAVKRLYVAYYYREYAATEIPEQDQEAFVTNLRKLLFNAFGYWSNMIAHKRYTDSKRITINNDYRLAAGLVGDYRGIKLTEADLSGSSGLSYGTGSGLNNVVSFIGAKKLLSLDTTPIDYYGTTNFSNHAWQEQLALGKIYCPISQPMFEYAMWMFSCVHADRGGESMQEMFVFHPYLSTILDYYSVTKMNMSGRFQTEINSFRTKCQALLTSDKAMKPLLNLLGLGAKGGNKFYDELSEIFKRDVMQRTLEVKPTDTYFYEALANATIGIVVPGYKTVNDSKSWEFEYFEAANASGESMIENNKVFAKDKQNIKVSDNTYYDYSKPENWNAGEIGSRTKWVGKPFCLVHINSTYWNTSTRVWEVVAPGYGMCDVSVTGSISDYSLILLTLDGYQKAADAESMGLNTISDTVKLRVEAAFKASAEPDGEAGNTFLVTLNAINRVVDVGYQEIEVAELKGITDYQYAYLAINYGQLKQVIDRIETLSLAYAINA